MRIIETQCTNIFTSHTFLGCQGQQAEDDGAGDKGRRVAVGGGCHRER